MGESSFGYARRMSSSASAPSRALASGGGVHCGTDPPGETTSIRGSRLDDPFPDYDTEPVMAFSAT